MSTTADPVAEACRREDAAQLMKALAMLSEPDQTVLRMRFWEDLTTREIAERLNQPYGTVLARMFRAIRKLRSHYSGCLS